MTVLRHSANAPAWFASALGHEPLCSVATVDNAAIEVLSWGIPGNPVLLFIHGNGAHAHWWSFVAPVFADRYHCIAYSLSGNGASGWRDTYSIEQFARDAVGALKACGVAPEADVTVIAHSLGGHVALALGQHADLVDRLIIIDTAVTDPRDLENSPPGPPPRGMAVYNERSEIRERYRLIPPEPDALDYIVEHLFDHSVEWDNSRKIWQWRADPYLWTKMDVEYKVMRTTRAVELTLALRCPLAYIYGANSAIATPDKVDFLRTLVARDTPIQAIPNAGHHVFVSKPLETIAALEGLLRRS